MNDDAFDFLQFTFDHQVFFRRGGPQVVNNVAQDIADVRFLHRALDWLREVLIMSLVKLQYFRQAVQVGLRFIERFAAGNRNHADTFDQRELGVNFLDQELKVFEFVGVEPCKQIAVRMVCEDEKTAGLSVREEQVDQLKMKIGSETVEPLLASDLFPERVIERDLLRQRFKGDVRGGQRRSRNINHRRRIQAVEKFDVRIGEHLRRQVVLMRGADFVDDPFADRRGQLREAFVAVLQSVNQPDEACVSFIREDRTEKSAAAGHRQTAEELRSGYVRNRQLSLTAHDF